MQLNVIIRFTILVLYKNLAHMQLKENVTLENIDNFYFSENAVFMCNYFKTFFIFIYIYISLYLYLYYIYIIFII